jgi:hypothetical protein
MAVCKADVVCGLKKQNEPIMKSILLYDLRLIMLCIFAISPNDIAILVESVRNWHRQNTKDTQNG